MRCSRTRSTHNLTDALTAIPLWIAFSLGRRRPTKAFTYGYHRVEDFAGLLIVAAIGASAALAAAESIRRLAEPRIIDHIPWVVIAGVVGALGNELVARYRIDVGRRIGSEALITDGHHARTDALTSLAVVAAALGAAAGAAWVDPAAGLLVAAAIVWLLVRSAHRMVRRLLDGIDPAIVDGVAKTVGGVAGVREVTSLQVRWHGHTLRIAASVSVDPAITVAAGHEIAHAVEHELRHAIGNDLAAIVHVEPHGRPEAHERTAHHQR